MEDNFVFVSGPCYEDEIEFWEGVKVGFPFGILIMSLLLYTFLV